jgi:hypothetical protein
MREQTPASASQLFEQHALLSVHVSPSNVHSGPLLLLLPPQAAISRTKQVRRTFFMFAPG